MQWPEPDDVPRECTIVDPCAGDGEAIFALRDLWTPKQDHDPEEGRPRILACELEAQRYATLFARLESPRLPYGNYERDRASHGDAFRLHLPEGELGFATVLYLNPPYDIDFLGGCDARVVGSPNRLEHRFLTRFTPYLFPGRGIVMYLVPAASLAASADFLAAEYTTPLLRRFPDPEFGDFRQVLFVARRAARPLDARAARRDAAAIREWVAKVETQATLEDRIQSPLLVMPSATYPYNLTMEPLDLSQALVGFEALPPASLGVDRSARELLGARYATAMPPKPAHIAFAVASGQFNGRRIEPNDEERDPPLLVKGLFRKKLLEIDVREGRSAKGEDVEVATMVERPTLELTALRLDTYSFLTLADGTLPTGSDEPAEWNTADLIARYSTSLARLLADQFPPLHDPRDGAARLPLPQLARTPYPAQVEAIHGVLKLLGSGKNPLLLGEVGTGKSTMALVTAAALAPAHHAETTAALRNLGFEHEPPRVSSTLIVCPPHLLTSWRDQIAAVLPEARVRVLSTLADLDGLRSQTDFCLLSRETAKLGPTVRGLDKKIHRCPKCGEDLKLDAAENAATRARCHHEGLEATDIVARVAIEVATRCAPLLPEEPAVRALVRGRITRKQLDRDSIPRPIRESDVERAAETILRALRATLEAEARIELAPNTSPSLVAWALSSPLETLLLALPKSHTLRAEALELRHAHSTRRPLFLYLEPDDSKQSSTSGDSHERPISSKLRDVLESALRKLREAANERATDPCNEPHFYAAPPRRFPLSRAIVRWHARAFDLLIVDEGHEYGRDESAQTRAIHRLIDLPGVPTILLTGSLMGGYASSLFPTFRALVPEFREQFGRDEIDRFVARFGFQKIKIERKAGADNTERLGTTTDRKLDRSKIVGEIPGIAPSFLIPHLLPNAVFLHKADLDIALPPLEETPVPLDVLSGFDAELLAEYQRLQRLLVARMSSFRFQPSRAGKLLGALVELPSYLDRATDDLEPFELVDPGEIPLEGGEPKPFAVGRSFPASWRTPKERWLLQEVKQRLAADERVLIFLRHTGSKLPQRLLTLLREVDPRVAFLDVKKVSTSKREDWINSQVLAKDVGVLLVHPKAVQTGLNNLVAFSVGIWHELETSATTYRQANGRLHRIGQKKPVSILVPYYPKTAQATMLDLVARKVSVSRLTDGLDLQAALEAAGAGEDQATAAAAAMSLGQAVYARLVERAN